MTDTDTESCILSSGNVWSKYIYSSNTDYEDPVLHRRTTVSRGYPKLMYSISEMSAIMSQDRENHITGNNGWEIIISIHNIRIPDLFQPNRLRSARRPWKRLLQMFACLMNSNKRLLKLMVRIIKLRIIRKIVYLAVTSDSIPILTINTNVTIKRLTTPKFAYHVNG